MRRGPEAGGVAGVLQPPALPPTVSAAEAPGRSVCPLASPLTCGAGSLASGRAPV